MSRDSTLAVVFLFLLPLAARCETPSLNAIVLIKAPESARFGRVLPVIKVLKDCGVRSIDFELSDSDAEGIAVTIRIHSDTKRRDAEKLAASLKKAGVVTVTVREAIPWRDFTSATLKELRGKNKRVLVFYRADWDVTPEILDRAVFQERRVIAAIDRHGYVPLRADVTHRPKEIEEFVREVGARSGEAAIVVFRGPKNESPVVLQTETSLKFISAEDLLSALKPSGAAKKSPAR